MTVVAEKVPKFRETIHIGAITERIKRNYYLDLTWLFDEYPIYDIRQAILRYWLDRSVPVPDQIADWIEQRVYDLKKEGTRAESGSYFWKDLLGWYVFNADSDYIFDRNVDLVSRAIEFAIKITKDGFADDVGFIYRSDILKIIAGRLERTPHIYQSPKMPSLKPFLKSFLVQEYESKHGIIDYELVGVKRVIRCAIAVKDWEFLPLIEKVLFKLRNQKKPERYEFRKEIEILESLAFLKEAVRLFKEKQKVEE